MLPMRSAAAAPCSLAALLLRRLSSHSCSSLYSVRRHASSAFSSQAAAASTTARFLPLSRSPRTRGFSAWASASGPAGPAESPATKALQAKIKEQLEADAVTVVDASGDGRHVWKVHTSSPYSACSDLGWKEMSMLLVAVFCEDMDNAKCTLCESILRNLGSIRRWISLLHLARSIAAKWCGNDSDDLGDSFWGCSGSTQKTKHNALFVHLAML